MTKKIWKRLVLRAAIFLSYEATLCGVSYLVRNSTIAQGMVFLGSLAGTSIVVVSTTLWLFDKDKKR